MIDISRISFPNDLQLAISVVKHLSDTLKSIYVTEDQSELIKCDVTLSTISFIYDIIWTVNISAKYNTVNSLKPWCFKSELFMGKNFCTPLPLVLYQTESAGYLSIASKLINMAAHMNISANEITSLRNMLISVQYWKDLGFPDNVSDVVFT
ncbi:hypothetical protein BCV71DRAFT_232185 [Rhizopus microsporus]|uniref:Uncharacterized protein n=1 Tax=Rhizopus microsporus TaxID=58291 RepID=A0A1X0SBA5_RHIZD|nr:hypothetical protein BCV71DRAFT_232185 [Rhizopus microsporus]